MNNEGYKNLIKIVSSGYTEGFYYKPRVDKDLLKKYNKGIIALSACLAGEVARKIVNHNIEGAKDSVKEYLEIFGKDRFFLEVQGNKLREQILVNSKLVEFSKEFGVGLVATNDCHYLNKEDSMRLVSLFRLDYKTMHLYTMSRIERNRCVEVILEYYKLHLPDFPEMKSFSVLQELFA